MKNYYWVFLCFLALMNTGCISVDEDDDDYSYDEGVSIDEGKIGNLTYKMVEFPDSMQPLDGSYSTYAVNDGVYVYGSYEIDENNDRSVLARYNGGIWVEETSYDGYIYDVSNHHEGDVTTPYVLVSTNDAGPQVYRRGEFTSYAGIIYRDVVVATGINDAIYTSTMTNAYNTSVKYNNGADSARLDLFPYATPAAFYSLVGTDNYVWGVLTSRSYVAGDSIYNLAHKREYKANEIGLYSGEKIITILPDDHDRIWVIGEKAIYTYTYGNTFSRVHDFRAIPHPTPINAGGALPMFNYHGDELVQDDWYIYFKGGLAFSKARYEMCTWLSGINSAQDIYANRDSNLFARLSSQMIGVDFFNYYFKSLTEDKLFVVDKPFDSEIKCY
jgi:hypothetical protein